MTTQVERARGRWQKIEDAVRRAAGEAEGDAQALVAELYTRMRTLEEDGGSPGATPDLELLDHLAAVEVRKQILRDRVLPRVERARAAAFASHVPLPSPPRRGG